MFDKEREAFEAYMGSDLISRDRDGHYVFEVESAWEAWQAARERYAPNLTDKQAVELIGEKASIFGVCGSEGSVSRRFGNEVVAALRAAGVNFREDA